METYAIDFPFVMCQLCWPMLCSMIAAGQPKRSHLLPVIIDLLIRIHIEGSLIFYIPGVIISSLKNEEGLTRLCSK